MLLILADDMGFSDVGCYGSEIHTPNIDALAAEGLRFTRFYNGARCCPSRASLLTGLYAQQTGVAEMDGNGHQPGYTGSPNDHCATLGQVLKTAGYQTFMAGKWHVGAMVPTTPGFDRFYGFYTGYAVNSYNPNQIIGRVIADLRAHHDLDDTIVFFLSDNGACAEWAPYGFDAKLGMTDGDGTRGDGHGFNGDSFVKPVLHVGPAALASMGQRVAGMTGIGFGSGWANACNTPFRIYKHYDYEGGIATPLVVRWPAGFEDKNVFRQQVGDVIDFMPTLAEVAGATCPKTLHDLPIDPMEGRSLVPAFTDQPIHRDAIYWEHEDNRAVRVGDLKLVSLAHRPWKLYDMSKDREELHDLSSALPDEAKRLAAMWDAWSIRCHVYPKPDGEKGPQPGPGEIQVKD